VSHGEVRLPETETETETENNTPKRAVAVTTDPVDNFEAGVSGEFLAAVWRTYAYDIAQPGPAVRDQQAWRARTAVEAKRRWWVQAVGLARACPTATPHDIAAALHANSPVDRMTDQIELEKTAAAGRALAASQHEAHRVHIDSWVKPDRSAVVGALSAARDALGAP
jgi:hypothetical protein